MKNRFSLALWSALFIGMFSCSSAVHGQTEGTTSLKIVPLNEQFPRMLYIDDLLFVSRYTDEHNQIHRESNDLSITFLDSRKESTKWQLQLKTEDFRCKKIWPSFDCRLSIRQRNVQRKERRSSRRIGSFRI